MNGGRGRGGSRASYSNQGVRGGNRQRGNRNRGNRPNGDPNERARHLSSLANAAAPNIPVPPGLGDGGSFGDRLTEDAETKEGDEKRGQTMTEDDVEAEVCFICASPVVHNSVAPCNHRTCHVCALRLRALYKTRACAHCRTEAKFVIFTDDATKSSTTPSLLVGY